MIVADICGKCMNTCKQGNTADGCTDFVQGVGRPKLSLREKIERNVWDSVDDVMAVIRRARLPMGDKNRWAWHRNQNCKYIEVRIDMRDGGCIIKNGDGQRISLSQLGWQYSEKTPKMPDENVKDYVNDPSDTV